MVVLKLDTLGARAGGFGINGAAYINFSGVDTAERPRAAA